MIKSKKPTVAQLAARIQTLEKNLQALKNRLDVLRERVEKGPTDKNKSLW